MKKIFALLIALAMLLSAAALAEDSTVYTLSLIDPQIVIGEQTEESEAVTIDLTGLDLDLSACVTDCGPQGLLLLLYAGEEEYEYVTGLLAQLDENGFGVFYDGMENMYAIDLEYLAGVSSAQLLSALPLRTLLAETSFEEVETESFALTAEDRIDILESVLGDFVYESLEQDGATVHNFSIPRVDFSEQIASMFEMAGSVSPDLAELSAYDYALELGGSITAEGSPSEGDAVWTVTSEGELFISDGAQEVSLPLTLEYTDDMSTFSLTFAMTTEVSTFSIALNGTSDVLSDGRDSVDYTLTLDADGEGITLRYASQPEEDTARVDTLIEMSANTAAESVYMALDLITDFDPDSAYSFYAALTGDDGTGESVVDLYYVGDPVDDPDAGLDTSGWVEITITDPETDPIAVNAYVYTYKEDMDTAEWVMDSSEAIDVTNMTDEDMDAASTDAMNVFQSDLTTLMEKVPALAALLG